MSPDVLVVFLFRSQHLCTTCSCAEDMKVHGMQLVVGSQSLPALSSGASASGSSVSGGGRGSARVYGLSCYLCGVKDDAADNVLPDLKRVWGYPPPILRPAATWASFAWCASAYIVHASEGSTRR